MCLSWVTLKKIEFLGVRNAQQPQIHGSGLVCHQTIGCLLSFSPPQLCHMSFMSLGYQTVHYYVHRRSQEGLTAVFPQSAEGRWLVQACLWFTASCTIGVYVVSFVSVWNMPAFWTALHQFFPLAFFWELQGGFFPPLVKMTSNLYFFFVKFLSYIIITQWPMAVTG